MKYLGKALSWSLVIGFLALIYNFGGLATNIISDLPHSVKVVHFIAYHILGFLLANAISEGSLKWRFWLAFSMATILAGGEEIHRHFFSHDGEFWNWFLAAVGAWVGTYFYLKSETVFRNSKRALKSKAKAFAKP